MKQRKTHDMRLTATDRQPREVDDPATISRLEQALESETLTSNLLRENLDALREKVELLETGFTARLEEATRQSASAEQRLADQQQRIAALGTGRQETLRQLAETRAELAQVRAERDELLQKLARIDGMQSSTIALTEEEIDKELAIPPLPSMDELMASIGELETGGSSPPAGGHALAKVRLDDDESEEMIAPELVFSDEETDETKSDLAGLDDEMSPVLVLLDAPHPVKYALFKKVMTIGRSEEADICMPGDYVSRVHARLVTTDTGVVVEDVASRNGITVNSKATDRQVLQHGDVLGIGKLRFTFIDSDAIQSK